MAKPKTSAAANDPSLPAVSAQINTNGFRRWHEYELTRSFGYLGLGVLSLIAGLAIMESTFDLPNSAQRWLKLFLSFFCLWGAAWAWLRFVKILIVAEVLSRQSVCDKCQRYGQITILSEDYDAENTAHLLTCRCKKCQHIWQMSYTLQLRDARL
jgi:hypothetical protein